MTRSDTLSCWLLSIGAPRSVTVVSAHPSVQWLTDGFLLGSNLGVIKLSVTCVLSTTTLCCKYFSRLMFQYNPSSAFEVDIKYTSLTYLKLHLWQMGGAAILLAVYHATSMAATGLAADGQ